MKNQFLNVNFKTNFTLMKNLRTLLIITATYLFATNVQAQTCYGLNENDFPQTCVSSDGTAPANQTFNYDYVTGTPTTGYSGGADGTDDVTVNMTATCNFPNGTNGSTYIAACLGPDGLESEHTMSGVGCDPAAGNPVGLQINIPGGSDFGGATCNDQPCSVCYVEVCYDFINGYSSEAAGFDAVWSSMNGGTEGYEAMVGWVEGTDNTGAPLATNGTTTAGLNSWCHADVLAGTLPVNAIFGATPPAGTFSADAITGDGAATACPTEEPGTSSGPDSSSDAATVAGANLGLNADDIITRMCFVYILSNNNADDCDADGETNVNTNPSGSLASVDVCPPPVEIIAECGACVEGSAGLVITELSYDPSSAQGADGDCEYIELFNSYSTPIVIDMNTTVMLSGGTTVVLPAGTVIQPGEYIILTGPNFAGCMFTNPPPAGTQIIDAGVAGTLGNGGEDVTLTLACAVNPAAGNTQMVTWSDGTTPNAGGGGLSVYYPLDGSGPLEGEPTPGSGDCVACANTPYVCDAAECTLTPDPAINIVCDNAGTPDDPSDDTYTFDVLVNGMNSDMAASNTFNDDQGNAGIAYGTTVSYGPFPIAGGDITVNYVDADDPDCINMIIAAAPAACSFPTAECGACVEGSAGLVITELSYDPSGAQGNDGDCEYIELFNSYSTPIVIDMNTTVMLSGGTTVVLPAGTTIAPGEYIILTGPNFSTMCTFANPPPAGTQIIDAGVAGTLGNGGEDVTITLACAIDGAAGNMQTVTWSDATTPNAGGGGQSVYYPLDGTGPIEGAPTPGSGDCVACANTPYECTDVVGVCSITPDPAINIVCDDNGTPGDPSDDTYTFDVLVNGMNTDAAASNTFNDDQGNAGFAYGTTVSYGPFPIAGGNITVTYTDVDDAMCANTVIAAAPATCSTDACEITSATVSNVVCNDGGTPEDPSDDTYTFDVTVNGNNPAAGASNTFNDDQGNTGIAYGTSVSYGPFPISGGDITVNYTDADDMTCTAVATAPAPAPCSSPVCDISNVVFTQACTGNGDEYELCLSFDYVNAGATGQFNVYLDPAGTLTPTTIVAGPFNYADYDAAIMGGATCFTLAGYTGDAADLEAGLEVCVGDVDAPAPGTGLPPGSTPPPAGIPTFACPQIYGILHNACAPVGGDEGPNEFVVIVNGADPTDVSSIVVDTPSGSDYDDFNTVTPPASWTCPCCVYLDETGSVPAGGVIVATSAANVSTLDFTSLCATAGTIYVLQDDGVGSTGHFSNSGPRATLLDLTGTPSCDGITSYSYTNADGNDGDYTTFAGPDNPGVTTAGSTIGTPDSGNIDSTGECTPQIAPASEVECFGCATLDEMACMQMVTCPVAAPVSNNQTLCSGDATTALSDWQAAVDAANPLDMTQDPDGLGSILYSSIPDDMSGTWMPDGDVSGITGVHSGADVCVLEDQIVYAYLFCSDDNTYQEIGLLTLTVYPLIEDAVELNNDGTCCPSVTVVCPGYLVSNTYDANGAIPDCSAETSSGSITFTIELPVDPIGGACLSYEVSGAYDCSVPTCQITPEMATNIVCNDNGTPGDPSDDTYTFDITVNGSSTFPGATNTFSDDQGNTGIAYGTTVSYGPFPISGGDVMVNFTDTEQQADCAGMMMAAAPAPCSGAMCSITPDMAINIVCNDNGTPADASDDTYTFDITVNGNNTFPGATNTFSDDQGNAGVAYGTTVSYGPFPIAGGNVVVNFTDTEQADCTGMMMAAVPAICSDPMSMCSIVPDMATNIICNDNGTPADPSDDTYTFDITVNGNSTLPGATNTFNDDQGNTGIAYGSTVSYGPFPISGGNVTVVFTDADDATCVGMMMATAPATCSNGVCEDEISGTVFAPAGCDVSGIEVTVFDNMGNIVATFITDAMGVYDSSPTTYPCGSYTVELTNNIPQCYEDADGDTGPKPFVIDGDDNNTDTDGQDFMPSGVPTLSQWGLICLALLLMVYGALMIAARTTAFEQYK